MATSNTSGVVLTANDVDDIAVHISEMWDNYNTERSTALHMGEEARQYIFATDIDQTSASILPHKNRTHQPKLTEISDALQSQYFEASLSMPQFFRFEGDTDEDHQNALKIEGWVRTKLEQIKFRETTGRQLIADFVNYGNCFCSVDYVVKENTSNEVIYKGPEILRVSPLDLVMNPRAQSFQKSPKVTRELVHVAEIAGLPAKFPRSGFKKNIIDKALLSRHPDYQDDWVEVIKSRGINMDGFGGFNQYFKAGLAELLIYRGDLFNPTTGKAQRNRIVYVLDKVWIIRNEENRAPQGFDGLHHTGWRIRNDNLWAQGALDNLVGMQYRIDHLENLKADVFDLIAHPNILVKGDQVQEPEEGFAPGAIWHAGIDESVEILQVPPEALRASNEIDVYHRLMEQFAGVPPETRGIRTPGEKTAFEVSKLDQNAAMMFVDKARNFERMLELVLREVFELMLIHFDGEDYARIFDDQTGAEQLKILSQSDVNSRGDFKAIGARHWTRRNRESLELLQFMQGPMQDPKVRAHIDGKQLAKVWEKKLNLEDEGIVAEYAGVKEDVRIQAIAAAEAQSFQDAGLGPQPTDGQEAQSAQGASPINPSQVQSRPENTPNLP